VTSSLSELAHLCVTQVRRFYDVGHGPLAPFRSLFDGFDPISDEAWQWFVVWSTVVVARGGWFRDQSPGLRVFGHSRS
jgi:hypothetical protein